eukprot:9480598-Pyramimonas_sp.AAC.1
MDWPEQRFVFIGERPASPSTVAVLVATQFRERVTQVPFYGDERAIWVQMPGDGASDPGYLLLAVYAPHPGFGAVLRRQFWEARLQEWRALRAPPH